MKPMRIVVIENDYSNDNMMTIRDVLHEFCGGDPRVFKMDTFSVSVVEEEKPDLLLVDIALKPTEESQINDETTGGCDPTPEFCAQLSGLRYCEKAKGAYPNLPLILMSQFDAANIIAACLAAGADGFLPKIMPGRSAVRSALKAAYMRSKTKDVEFVEATRRLLENDSCWHKSHVEAASEVFFTKGSAGRRLVRLWVALADLVMPGVAESLVTRLVGFQVDAEALLLAANPRIRDHLHHSGNVFWLGYHLLNSVAAFRSSTSVSTHPHADFLSGFTGATDHLHCTWILCSLLHDLAYLRDRIATVEDRLNSGREFFGLQKKRASKRVADFPSAETTSLKRYLSSSAFGGPGERLANALTAVEAAWGKARGGKAEFEDHGVVAAAALLGAVPESERTAEIMHAAAAMALHNLPKWVKDLSLPDTVELPFDLLPCANLLALCDELQGWGREPVRDPLSFEGKDLKQMRSIVRQGYIEGSRIGHFAVDELDAKATIEITIHYEMAPGEGTAGVNLRTDIAGWRTVRAPDVSRVLKLSDHFARVRIRHVIPDDKPEAEDVYLAGGPS